MQELNDKSWLLQSQSKKPKGIVRQIDVGSDHLFCSCVMLISIITKRIQRYFYKFIQQTVYNIKQTRCDILS